MNLIREKGELENKIADLEAQNVVADQKEEQYEAQEVRIEARKSSLDVLLKTTNENKADISPLTKQHSL